MVKIVLDACVPIDLNMSKINILEICLNYLNEDKIYISSVNFDEIKDIKVKDILRKYKVNIILHDENNFKKFSSEVEYLKINLSKNDRHVLFLAYTQEADS